jgi:protoporphyrinogen oxidase
MHAEYEESVEQFIRRNLGDEVFERLIEPFCSGVYAGNPSKLSMKAAFQRVRAAGGGAWLVLLQHRRAGVAALLLLFCNSSVSLAAVACETATPH